MIGELFGFGGEAHQDLAGPFPLAHNLRHVGGGHQMQIQGAVALLFELLGRSLLGPIIGGRGSLDDHVLAIAQGQHIVQQILRGLDGHHLHALGGGQLHRARHQGHLGAPAGGGLRDGVAHLAAGAVGEEAHGVHGLPGGPGGDQHPQARHILGRGEDLDTLFHDLRRLAHAARAHVAAGQQAPFGADGQDAAGQQNPEVFPGGDIVPHAGVHGRGDEHGRAGGQHGGGQHIVRDAMGHFGHDIGGGRGDQKQIGLLGQGHVLHLPALGTVKGVRDAGIIAEGLKGEGRNELAGVRGHDDMHPRARFAQTGNHLAALVGRDASRDAHDHGFSIQCAHYPLDLLVFQIAAIGEQAAVDLLDGQGDGLHVLGLNQGLSAGHQLTGALGRLNDQGITAVHLLGQFHDAGLIDRHI